MSGVWSLLIMHISTVSTLSQEAATLLHYVILVNTCSKHCSVCESSDVTLKVPFETGIILQRIAFFSCYVNYKFDA